MMAVANVTSSSGFVDNWQSGKSLAEGNLHMLTSEDSCDVSFRVGKAEKIVRAHRYVLISRSCVFHAMLCGPLAEKNEITITDVEADILSELLRYLYTNTSEPTSVNVTGLLYLAKKYAVGGLEQLCLTFLKSSLSAENACVILEQAHVFDEKQLYDTAMKVILDNGEECLDSEGFKHLCPECLHKVISSDDLNLKADHVFSPAILWSEEECKRQGRELTSCNLRSVLGKTLFSIPFPDMDPKYYVEEVLPRHILTDGENVAIMAHHVSSERNPSPFRKRQQKVNLDVERTLELPLLQLTDLIFVNKHKRASCFGQNESGSVRFICSHDVDLIGVYVFGPATYHMSYSLRVHKPSKHNIYNLSNEECPSFVLSNENHIRIIKPQKPLQIKKGVKHTLKVRQCRQEAPVYEGDTVLKAVNVGHLTFSNIDSNGPAHLIYGLRISQ